MPGGSSPLGRPPLSLGTETTTTPDVTACRGLLVRGGRRARPRACMARIPYPEPGDTSSPESWLDKILKRLLGPDAVARVFSVSLRDAKVDSDFLVCFRAIPELRDLPVLLLWFDTQILAAPSGRRHHLRDDSDAERAQDSAIAGPQFLSRSGRPRSRTQMLAPSQATACGKFPTGNERPEIGAHFRMATQRNGLVARPTAPVAPATWHQWRRMLRLVHSRQPLPDFRLSRLRRLCRSLRACSDRSGWPGPAGRWVQFHPVGPLGHYYRSTRSIQSIR